MCCSGLRKLKTSSNGRFGSITSCKFCYFLIFIPSISFSASSDVFVKNIQKKKRSHKTSDPDLNGKEFLIFKSQ